MNHAQRGASMVEFAISASALMLIMFGILEFGRVMYTYHTVSNAARLASRWAMVRGANCSLLDHCNATSADVQSFVIANVPMVDSSSTTAAGCSQAGLCASATWSTSTDPSVDCTATDPSGNNVPGHLVCVTVTYPFNFAIPFVSNTPLTLSSTSKMVISN
jgi:Flp pilus assembly protein TadG